MPSSKTPWLLLAVVLLAAACLRLRGLDRELPHVPEPDSYLVLQTEILREGRTPDMKQSEKGYYAYPLPLARGLALLEKPELPREAPLERQLSAAAADATRARLLVALLSLLLVPATWALARRFTTPLGALLAAAFTATSLLHLEFSQQARHHAPHASFALLAVLAAFQLRERPTWARYLAASALSLLALAMLHSGWFALLPILAAHALAERDGPRAPWWAVAAPVAASAFAWLTLYPRVEGKLDESASISEGGHTLYWRDLDFSGFGTGARLLWDYDPGLSVAAAIGALVTLAGARTAWRALEPARRRQLLVALAYALPYGLALGVYKETCDRMLLPLVPFLATLGGIGVVHLTRLAPPVARVGVLGLALATPTLGAVRYAATRDARDTLEQAADWIVEHTQGRTLVCSRFALPLASDARALELVRNDHASRQKRWVRYQLERGELAGARDVVPVPGRVLVGADPDKSRARLHAFVAEQDPEWVLIEVSKYTRINPMMMELREWAGTRGTLTASFRGEPGARDMEPSLDYQDVAHLFWRLLSAEAFGPTFELYHIRR